MSKLTNHDILTQAKSYPHDYLPLYVPGDYDEGELASLNRELQALGLDALPDDTHGGVWVMEVAKGVYETSTGTSGAGGSAQRHVHNNSRMG